MPNAYNIAALLAVLAVLGAVEVATGYGPAVVTLAADGTVVYVGPWGADVAARVPSAARFRARSVSTIVDGARYGCPGVRYIETKHFTDTSARGDGAITYSRLANVTSDAVR